MYVLSLFDGMSCGQIALERAAKSVTKYYACEINTPAIKVAKSNYPNMISLGDITTTFYTNTGFELKGDGSWVDVTDSNHGIDLLIGGSPCQDISNLSKLKLGVEGDKSSLFYHFLRLKKETNPKYFLLENVVGNKKSINTISKLMGVRPIKISSNWVSAQNRMRYYWTNIPVNSLPKKKNIRLVDILEKSVDEKYFLKDGRLKWILGDSGQKSLEKKFTRLDPLRASCLTKSGEKSWNCNYVTDNGRIRKLTPIECERLQTVPDNYTSMVEDADRYEMLGNGWTVDIIAHILKHIK